MEFVVAAISKIPTFGSFLILKTVFLIKNNKIHKNIGIRCTVLTRSSRPGTTLDRSSSSRSPDPQIISTIQALCVDFDSQPPTVVSSICNPLGGQSVKWPNIETECSDRADHLWDLEFSMSWIDLEWSPGCNPDIGVTKICF